MPDNVRESDNGTATNRVVGVMPWSSTDPTKERIKFVLEWEKRWNAGEGRTNLSELCREFGISRETAYVWLRRYRRSGRDLRSLNEGSHRSAKVATDVGGAKAARLPGG